MKLQKVPYYMKFILVKSHEIQQEQNISKIESMQQASQHWNLLQEDEKLFYKQKFSKNLQEQNYSKNQHVQKYFKNEQDNMQVLLLSINEILEQIISQDLCPLEGAKMVFEAENTNQIFKDISQKKKLYYVEQFEEIQANSKLLLVQTFKYMKLTKKNPFQHADPESFMKLHSKAVQLDNFQWQDLNSVDKLPYQICSLLIYKFPYKNYYNSISKFIKYDQIQLQVINSKYDILINKEWRPFNPQTIWFQENFNSLKSLNSDLNQTQIQTLGQGIWQCLTNKEKLPYIKQYEYKIEKYQNDQNLRKNQIKSKNYV